MLDFFAVITKGGLVLWYFQDAVQRLDTSITAVNDLIRNVILQEHGGINIYHYDNLALKLRMDNEFDLLFVVIYQKLLQLAYVDKFLSDVQLKFRDQFKEQLQKGLYYQSFEFSKEYTNILEAAEKDITFLKAVARSPRSFDQSEKSKKTVESMIEKRGTLSAKEAKAAKKKQEGKANSVGPMLITNTEVTDDEIIEDITATENQQDEEETLLQNREKLFGSKKFAGTGKASKGQDKTKSPKPVGKKGKDKRIWELDGKDSISLDYSLKNNCSKGTAAHSLRPDFLPDPSQIGSQGGNLKAVEVVEQANVKQSSGGVFSLFRGLVGGRTLTSTDIEPALDKLQDHLISKNVAAEIASKLCQSIGNKLEGKHIGTFEGVSSTVRATLTEALVQLLTPKRRLDVLRDIQEAKAADRPYSITFCGVNGVGKSTNLAKVAFWLIENDYRVLIAACDTFRAGAVEQLRTHMHHLNDLHPPEKHKNKQMVQLFEQGYGKDAAEIARHAIEFARKNSFDVVLIDTAGRMQDNEPLMRALAKLIHVNEPDLTLFVGEALVGNEAVDQLVKFNRALADHTTATHPQMIDGVVLTKFDTIDDKVGAAISMTYITGQPIVFVGTGQTYTDLRKLDAKAVVAALMK